MGKIRFKEMRDLIGVEDAEKGDYKLKRENVDLRLKLIQVISYPNEIRIIKIESYL